MIPPYAPSVPDWMRQVAAQANPVLARFRGSLSFQVEDFPGFYYSVDIDNTRFLDSAGTSANPLTNTDAIFALSKHSNASDDTEINPTFAVQQYEHGARGSAILGEIIGSSTDVASFVEGGRFHGTAIAGGKGYGVIGQGQVNDADGVNAVGGEFVTLRTAGVDSMDPRSWVSGLNQQLDACVIGTVGDGKKPMGGFVLNPFNPVAVKAGFLAGIDAKVDIATFMSLAATPYAFYADHCTTALMVGPNNIPIKMKDGSGNEDDVLRYASDSWVHVGTDATGVRLYGSVKFGTFTSNADAAITGYITITDSAGTARKLATIA